MAEDDIMNNISNVNVISDLPLKKNKKTYKIIRYMFQNKTFSRT